MTNINKNDYDIDDDDLGFSHDYRHTIVMILLYLSQGMVQGSNSACATLLLQHNPNLSMADQSLLTLPGYAFSFKFLWAPIVDSVYVSKRTRRPLWIISCQVLICILSLVVRAFWVDVLREDVAVLATVMGFMSFTVATQDIAVDSWAIEGVSDKRTGWASTAQTIGLLTGWTFTRSFFILQEWGFVSKETGAVGLFSVLFGVQVSTLVLVSIYRFYSSTCQVALNEAMRKERHVMMLAKSSKNKNNNNSLGSNSRIDNDRKSNIHHDDNINRSENNKRGKEEEKQEEDDVRNENLLTTSTSTSTTTWEAFTNVLTDMKEVAQQSWFRDVCVVLLLRGVFFASSGLVGTELMKRFGVSPAFSSSLSLALLPLQFFVSSLAPAIFASLKHSRKLNLRLSTVESWHLLIFIDMLFEILSGFTFTFSASDSFQYRMFAVIPSSIVSTITHTIIFNGMSTIFGKIASKTPHSTGTAVTMLNSLANFGSAWPQTFALYLGGTIPEIFFDRDGKKATTDSSSLIVSNYLMWIFFGLGLVIHWFVSKPAVVRLKNVVDGDGDEEREEAEKDEQKSKRE